MNSFCESVLLYIRKENDIEQILALILRDIFLNDLTYIAHEKTWMQYSTASKKWCPFDANVFWGKLRSIQKFMEGTLKAYIANGKHTLSAIEVLYVNKFVAIMCNHIKYYLEKEAFLNQCKVYFTASS